MIGSVRAPRKKFLLGLQVEVTRYHAHHGEPHQQNHRGKHLVLEACSPLSQPDVVLSKRIHVTQEPSGIAVVAIVAFGAPGLYLREAFVWQGRKIFSLAPLVASLAPPQLR
jgi:hypothetical protein